MTTLDGGQPGGSRKRPRMLRNDPPSTAAAEETYNNRPSPGFHGANAPHDAQACKKPCHHEATLDSLHAELDTMRSLLSCQVCRRLMYEPYALSCGHTYCYSCIDQWMHHKKECPSCRSKIAQQPTQSYALRELVSVFASRTQLLADGETSEEHKALAKEEQQAMARDRENTVEGGLFKGLFTKDASDRLLPIRDPVDGVDRCPTCHWEIEDGYCNSCGRPVGDDMSDFSSDSDEDEDLDEDLVNDDNDEDDLGGFVMDPDEEDDTAFDARDFHRDGQMLAQLNASRSRVQRPQDLGPADDEELRSSDDEGDSTMGDFVVDDDAEPSFLSDDEDALSELSQSGSMDGLPLVVDSSEGGSDDQEDEADDEEGGEPRGTAGSRHRHTMPHRKRPIVVSSDDEEEEDENFHVPGRAPSVPAHTRIWNNGFSPIQVGSDDERSDTHHYDENELVSSDSSQSNDSDSVDQPLDAADNDESQDEVGNYDGFGGYDEDDDDDDSEDHGS